MASKNSKDHKYTDEELDFIRDRVDSMSYDSLAVIFTETYGVPMDKSKLYSVCKRHGIKKSKRVENKPRKSRDGYHVYSDEEKTFIISIFDGCESYEELRNIFNTRFGVNVSSCSIHDLCCKRLSLKRSVNKGQYIAGESKERQSIGSEVDKDGYIWIKVDNSFDRDCDRNANYYNNWIPKHKYIYEQVHGKVPDGKFVIFLDGDRRNFDIDNLYCVDRKIHAVMCSNSWYTFSREHTLTAIKWCELYYAMKD